LQKSHTPKSFYKTILEQLGIESKFTRGDAKRQLHKQVEILKAVNNVSPVAIVDEAHLLSREMLEEIRFLLNYKMDSVSPMALILTGQSELWDKLKLQSYAAVRGRIDIVCHIGCLERSQVEDYIRAHLAYAGCEKTIFADGAVEEIFKFSGGIPRLVNKACTSSLIYGAQNKKNIIEERTVKLIIEQELN